MSTEYRKILENEVVKASAPCRVDMGGTLDINIFNYPLSSLSPSTFNIAIDLRTNVSLFPFEDGKIKVSSKGFESAVFPAGEAPFLHPLGLMFAIATYFGASGVHINIESSSPPKSALGGSSVAAVALVACFLKITEDSVLDENLRERAAIIAHAIENSVAGVPCGFQDQLAAAYGGVNSWIWPGRADGREFEKKSILGGDDLKSLEDNFLVAYCGAPHESKDINGRWVKQFLSGENRTLWAEIISCTNKFSEAVAKGDFTEAATHMNREADIRRGMTPDVFDDMGNILSEAAINEKCGVRFTGAGGGGCIWAIGESAHIKNLKESWASLMIRNENARMLTSVVDSEGVIFEGF